MFVHHVLTEKIYVIASIELTMLKRPYDVQGGETIVQQLKNKLLSIYVHQNFFGPCKKVAKSPLHQTCHCLS